MAFQHIFTSAQMGLHPGSSGYCTVAQSEGIPGDLVKALERLSTYDFSAKNDPEMGGHSPVIYSYQVVQSHSGHYFVVSRISDAGADHTGRTNYLAQHLALDSSEILQLRDYPHLNPAALLLIGLPWKKTWDEMPQTLPNLEVEDLFPEHPMYGELEENGCTTWKNNPLRTSPDQAPTLLESPWSTKCFLHLPPGQERVLLKLLVETLWLSDEEAWRYGFTTFLQHEESHENYAWCAVSGGNAKERASGAGQMLWEIPSLPQASDEALKYKAETGQEKPIEPEPAPAPEPAPEPTQPFPANPAGPFHRESPPDPTLPDPTLQPRPQPQPTQATSQQPPTAEEFVKKMQSLGTTPSADAYATQYGKKHKEYAEFIKQQIRNSDSHKFIKKYHGDVYKLKTNLEASVKNISAARQARQRAVLGICIKYYEPIDKIIKEKQKIIEANLKGGTQEITSAPPPPPPPTNGTPENGTQKKFPWKEVIVALGLAVAVIFILIKFVGKKDKINAGDGQQGGGQQGGDNQGGNNQGGNNQGGNNPGGNNPGGNNPGGNNPGGNNPGGNTTNPGDEYRTSPEFKTKVNKYFGTGNTKVRLFVAPDGLLNLTGVHVPELFKVLSKNLSNPKPTEGLSGSIDVYQPQSTNGFEGLMWKPADPAVLPSSVVELLYVRSASGNGSIAISGVPKWPKLKARPGMTVELAQKVLDTEIKNLKKSTFSIKVKKNTAIRVKTAVKTEIIYILNKPGIFFDGLFDEAVNKPKGSGLAKLVIDPYLMNRLNQHVLYNGVPTTSNLVMAVPESVYKADKLPPMLGLNLKNQAGREWVAITHELDRLINAYRNPPFARHSILAVKNEAGELVYNETNEFLYKIGFQPKMVIKKGAKITLKAPAKFEVTRMFAGTKQEQLELTKDGNIFTLEMDTILNPDFFCWVKSKNQANLSRQGNIVFKLEFSNPQKNELAKPHEKQKEDRMKAFRETLKVDTTLGYYKPNSSGALVMRFNRKK